MASRVPFQLTDATHFRAAVRLSVAAVVAFALAALFLISSDAVPSHAEGSDVGLSSCVKEGPAPINLSDTIGAYMYLSCAVTNHSEHGVWTITSDPGAVILSGVPTGCLAKTILIVPGSTAFSLAAGESMIVNYRTHWQCHAPAVESTFLIQTMLRVDHLSSDGTCEEDPNSSNDSFSASQYGIIGPVAPESTPGPTPTAPTSTPEGTANPCEDSDGDGFVNAIEWHVGTEAGASCGVDGWPADLYAAGASFNKVTIHDIVSFVYPTRHLDTSPGEPGYDARWDIVPGSSIFASQINIQDALEVAVVEPPMLGGEPAYNHTCPGP